MAESYAAAALGVLFYGALDGIRAARIATKSQEALELARSHLAMNAAAPVPGNREGDDGNGYHWRIDVRPIDAFDGSPGAASTARSPPAPVTLYAITVWVGWRDGSGAHDVRLDAERLFTPASPPAPTGLRNAVPTGQ